MMTKYKLNVGHSNLQDQKIFRDFAEEMNFDNKKVDQPSTRDKSHIKLLNSLAIMASGVLTKFLSSVFNELCDRLKFLLQQKQAGKNSNIINEEIVAIVDKLFEDKCISTKQLKQLLNNCNLVHTKISEYARISIITH